MSGVGSTEPRQRAEAAAVPPLERGLSGVGSTEPRQRAEAAAVPPLERA